MKFSCTILLSFCAIVATACSSQREQKEAVTNQKSVAQVSESTCPDNPKVDLRDCEFAEIRSSLNSKSDAQERYRAASAKCGSYDQVTINFCVGTLRVEADAELIRAYGNAQPSPEVATYLDWKSRIDKMCTPDYPAEEGGSGYSSRISFCKLIKYSEKIDRLNGTVKGK